jgi:hypothetical protein
MKKILLLILLLPAFLSAHQSYKSEIKDIKDAVGSTLAPAVGNKTLRVIKLKGDWAKVIMYFGGDILIGYVKYDHFHKQWYLAYYGTAFPPADCDKFGIPKEIR